MSVLGTIGLAYKARLCLIGDELIEEIRKGKVSLVVIASDCGPASLKKLSDKCNSFNVKTITYATKSELANAIGKVNVASIGIKDDKLAIKIFNEIEKEKTKEVD